MTLFDKLFLALYFLAIIFIQAKWQTALFKANKPISHVKHAVLYILTIGPAVWMFWPVSWQVIVVGLLCRLAFFDFALSLFRKKPVFYNLKVDKSWQDSIENRLSKTWVKILKVSYVVVFIVVLIIL